MSFTMASPLCGVLPLVLVLFLQVWLASSSAFNPLSAAADPAEPTYYWRPLLHFTPSRNWINDPNVSHLQALLHPPIAPAHLSTPLTPLLRPLPAPLLPRV